jgi:hypothetical protein
MLSGAGQAINFADGLATDAMAAQEKKITAFFSQVPRAEIGPGLSGSAGVLAYSFLAYYLFGTTLCLVVHSVGLSLLFLGLCSFLCHAKSLPQARSDS